MATGWRKGFADVVAAIRATLADAANAGSMSAADFLKLAGLPSSAVPTSRLVNTTAPLTGGGDLSADRTLAISAASGVAAGSMSAADFSKLATVPAGASLPTWGVTGTVDYLAAAPTVWPINLPLAAGKSFVPNACMVVWDTITGTATGNLNISVGNANGLGGAPLANVYLNTNIAAASINAGSGFTPYRFTFNTSAGPLADMTTTQISLRVNANPPGLTALTGRVFLFGAYV